MWASVTVLKRTFACLRSWLASSPLSNLIGSVFFHFQKYLSWKSTVSREGHQKKGKIVCSVGLEYCIGCILVACWAFSRASWGPLGALAASWELLWGSLGKNQKWCTTPHGCRPKSPPKAPPKARKSPAKASKKPFYPCIHCYVLLFS